MKIPGIPDVWFFKHHSIFYLPELKKKPQLFVFWHISFGSCLRNQWNQMVWAANVFGGYSWDQACWCHLKTNLHKQNREAFQ